MRAIKPTIAALFAYSAFAVAVVSGIAAGNPTDVILTRGIGAMLVAYLLGLLLARVAMVGVEEFLSDRSAHDERTIEAVPADDVLADVEILDEPAEVAA